LNQPLFRWGIIGPGRIAQAFARAIAVVADATIHAVASRDHARAQEFAQAYAVPTTYASYADLIADPAIDAIYIAIPHRFHVEQALRCLEAGKAVLCEKPLTVNAREASLLIETARAKRVFLLEAVWTRYLPIFQHVRRWLDAGSVGEIRLLSSTFGFSAARDPQDRLWNHDLAGGALLDLGIYNLTLSQWVMGAEPLAFSAQAILGATEVDELTAVNLQYANGGVSQWTCTLLADTSNSFHIYGSAGHIQVHTPFWGATRATLATAGQELTVSEPFRASGFEYQIEDAMRCIRAGLIESPTMPHAQTLATMTLMDQIRARVGLRYRFEE
jgi:predicted dehydrogenase